MSSLGIWIAFRIGGLGLGRWRLGPWPPSTLPGGGLHCLESRDRPANRVMFLAEFFEDFLQVHSAFAPPAAV